MEILGWKLSRWSLVTHTKLSADAMLNSDTPALASWRQLPWPPAHVMP